MMPLLFVLFLGLGAYIFTLPVPDMDTGIFLH